MKTTANIARVSAKMIRKATRDLRAIPEPPKGSVARELRANALGVLDEVATQLDTYATAFEPATATDARSTSEGVQV